MALTNANKSLLTLLRYYASACSGALADLAGEGLDKIVRVFDEIAVLRIAEETSNGIRVRGSFIQCVTFIRHRILRSDLRHIIPQIDESVKGN